MPWVTTQENSDTTDNDISAKKNTQSRKWLITVNNPVDKGYDHDKIKEILLFLPSLVYFCMADEVGENGTPHTHVYVACKAPIRFSTVKNLFPPADLAMAKGTSQENRDYIFKAGKWAGHKKSETNIKESQYEYGEMPQERPGKTSGMADLYKSIASGMSDMEIISLFPAHLFRLDKIGIARQAMLQEAYRTTFRVMSVTYIYGPTGTGKTRGVLETYGYPNVYRVTDYNHPFDGYKSQQTIVFEEFNSQIKITDMLTLLDGYPLDLPCRYANKVACYDRVYIISNIPLTKQYEGVQKNANYTWLAFLRRITMVRSYDHHAGEYFERPTGDEFWWEDIGQ